MFVPMSVSPLTARIIANKKARYGRLIDTKQWDRFREVALADASFQFFEADGAPTKIGTTALVFDTTDSLVAFFKKFFARAETLHMFGPGELEHISEHEVQAIWASKQFRWLFFLPVLASFSRANTADQGGVKAPATAPELPKASPGYL
ncbi:hypothetical protein BJ170DRAFT_617491 [Xylariales sp. AK1849]|nr:hypothetical protein BJ170DRAFT_617491 [Xylariales sp. AK1849]